jgi:hypothetical protein
MTKDVWLYNPLNGMPRHADEIAADPHGEEFIGKDRVDAETYRWMCKHRVGWFSRMAPIPWNGQSMKEALDSSVRAAREPS